VELRRALLLFAIVLGLAAIASSIAQPPERDNGESARPEQADSSSGGTADTTPSVSPQPDRPAASLTTIRFPAAAKPPTRKLEQDRPAMLLVEVAGAGQVDIPRLGLTQAAEPLTPARFDVLISDPGTYPIVVDPAGAGAPPRRGAVLRVVPAS
jgi:hypothetical protein